MLREVKNKHVKPRIVTFVGTTTASTATLSNGYGDYTVSRSGTGAGTISHRQGFARGGLTFLSQSVVAGGYATINSTTSNKLSSAFSLLNASGTANEGTFDGFTFGWDSSDLSLCKQQRVASTSSGERINWGKITGSSGAVAINSGDFSCSRTASGTYSVTFRRPYGQTPVVVVTGISSAGASTALLSSKSASGVTVTMAPETGTPTDSDFYIVVIGQDSRSDAGRERSPLLNSQRKPRILAAEITNTGGTWSLTQGGATGGIDFTSLTDNGAGDFSVTIAEPFAREPAILVCTTTQRAQVHSYSANVIRVLTKNSAGSNADTNGVTHLFVIGSDDGASY